MTDYNKLQYQAGFGNHVQSEAIPNSLPKLGNAPQKAPHGLYTEVISGTAFTAPRHKNQRDWVYRIRPSVQHQPFQPYKGNDKIVGSFYPFSPNIEATPQQLRWDPLSFPGDDKADFVDGLVTMGGAGDAQMKNGLAVHFYAFGKDMGNKSLYNSDGDFLIVPVEGDLLITTEFGKLYVPPLFIAVVQRGLKFKVDFVNRKPNQTAARGFICEIFKGHWELPELGPIGSNCLANTKDFETPVAAYEDVDGDYLCVNKFMGQLFQFNQGHSPFDVVAFSGNYVPYRYDLKKFNVLGTVTYDHPDPSLYTVLTCPSDTPGTAIADFVLFAPRWLVGEDTFRPPWYHRNVMSEWMANISGTYDAKAEGFLPGGMSLHNMNTAHGPDTETFEKASVAELKPHKTDENSYAIMFESMAQLATTKWAITESGKVQQDYWQAWQGLKKHFKAPK